MSGSPDLPGQEKWKGIASMRKASYYICPVCGNLNICTGPGEKVTLKIANYAVLEKGYDEFWSSVKAGYEEKYPNVTIEWVTAPYGEMCIRDRLIPRLIKL